MAGISFSQWEWENTPGACFTQVPYEKLRRIDHPPPASTSNVLDQPTRARLFALLGELRRPATTDELAVRLGLHPNGVRLHLDLLRDAGMVARARPQGERGRPRDRWSVAPGARPGGEPPHAYRDLGRWLARATPGDAERLAEVETTGREIGRELIERQAEPALAEAMEAALTALGFQPVASAAPAGGASFALANCPYRDAVAENQSVVCTLHRGITRGILDVMAPGARLTAFVPKDPYEAGCLIEVRS